MTVAPATNALDAKPAAASDAWNSVIAYTAIVVMST